MLLGRHWVGVPSGAGRTCTHHKCSPAEPLLPLGILLELRMMGADPLKSHTFLAGASGEWMGGTFWEAMAQKGDVRCSGV